MFIIGDLSIEEKNTMAQRIEVTDLRTNEQMTMTFPSRYIRQLLPMLAGFERLVAGRNYQVSFIPPLRIENEATGEHFYLGRPSIPKPILLAATVIALEEVASF